MKIHIKKNISKKNLFTIIPVFKDQKLSASDIPTATKNIKTLEKEFKKESGEKKYLPDNSQIVLISLGESKKLKSAKIREFGATCVKMAGSQKANEFNIFLPEQSLNFAQELVEGIILSNFNAGKFQTGKNKEKAEKKLIKEVNLIVKKETKILSDKVKKGQILAESVNETRDMVNAPNNYANANTLAAEAKKIAKENGYKISIYDKKQLQKMKMGAILAVNAGSTIGAKLVVMEYKPKGATNKKPIMVVGKGVTFDSGGYNLKPTGAITDMKKDMAGAATVFGLFKVLKKLGIKKHVIGITPLTENLVSSNAYKVDDIITAYNGKTIEVLNTDAEGRLILADALSYGVKKYKPEAVIDLATLTGAILVALGDRYAGVFGNNKDLSQQILKAGEETDELCWELPIHEDFKKRTEGSLADLKNVTNTGLAGSSTAAAFLEHFVDKAKWAHIDIAGVAWSKFPKSFDNQHSTGFGVRLLTKYLEG
ncbi:aminopeptidase [Candidatus Peregrinibacteria bacterium]|nr:aminopeptidase [Candidatus Peregrinibacteria bacterium]